MQEAQQDGASESTKNQNGSEAAASSGMSRLLSDGSAKELFKKGITAFGRESYMESAQSFEELLSIAPEHWKAMACLALSNFHLGRYDHAEEIFTKVIADCPDASIVVKCVESLDKTRAAMGHSAPAPVEEYVGGNGSEAMPELSKPVAPGEHDPQATGAFEKKDLTPEERTKFIKWGTNCYLDGKFPKAIEYLEFGLSGDEENWAARLTLGMSYFKMEQFDLAQIIIHSIISKCEDPKIVLRAKQALENIRVSNMQIDTEAAEQYEEKLAKRDAEKKERHRQRKESAMALHAATIAAREEAKAAAEEASGPRNTHPLAYVALVILVTGVVYYTALQMLPQTYKAIFLVNAQTAGKSVDDLGNFGDNLGQGFDVPAANGNKLRAHFYEKGGARSVVIVHPATYDDFEMRKSLAQALYDAGFSVFLYDGRGHGHSSGTVSWQGLGDDGVFAHDFVHGKLGFKSGEIVSYGCSMGSAAAELTSRSRQHLALILENPFPNLPTLARERAPWLAIFPDCWCPSPQYAVKDLMSNHAPTLIVQSKDPIVSAADTQDVFSHMTGGKQLVTSSSSVSSPHWEEITKFLQKI
jgi:tetratricopeptide (TPR) repeat protein